MTAEYRRMLREQELKGRMELGWLDPDEVAWLEEEMRRETGKTYAADGELYWARFHIS